MRHTRMFVTLICSIGCCLAHAQTAGTFLPIESLVAKADSVYKGRITSVSYDERHEISLAVGVDEVIKGTPRKTLYLLQQGDAFETFDKWRQSRTPFLWFMDKPASNRPTVAWTCHRLGPPAGIGYDLLDRIDIFSMDLTVLHDPKSILEHAREFSKHNPGQPKMFKSIVSRAFVSQIGYSFDGNDMELPVTPELEPIARHLVERPEDRAPKLSQLPADQERFAAKWRKSELANLRVMGINALSYFKSDRNVSLLKDQLTDDSIMGDSHGGYVYWVRKAAYDVLQTWGVQVLLPDLVPAKPPIE